MRGGCVLPIMEDAFFFQYSRKLLELKADPTPKRPQNRNQHNPRILAIYRHIALRQQIAEVSQHFPPARGSKAWKWLAQRHMQVGIQLVGSLAKGVHARKRSSRYPHVTRCKLCSGTRQFPGYARAHAVMFARRETIAEISGRGAQISLWG